MSIGVEVSAPENAGAHYCERCGEKLNPSTLVWLELNMNTGRYHEDGMVPADESQGCFTFGTACARAVLAAGGENKRIRGGK